MRGSSALIRHSMAWPSKRDVVLRERQAEAGGDADLLVDEVDAGDRLGDRMLDLQAGVHLDEIELAVLVEELDRAGAGIAERRRWPWRRSPPILALASALIAGEGASSQTFWWRRCSEQSRSPRWTPPPLPSPMHLDLDMARLVEIFLDIDRVVAEGGPGLGAGGGERVRAVRSALRATFMPRPPPPAAALISTG